MSESTEHKTATKISEDMEKNGFNSGGATDRIEVGNVLAEMEKALDDIATENPRLGEKDKNNLTRFEDLKSILEISIAINSSFVLDDILQVVMEKAVELLDAERGFIMLLDKSNKLRFQTAHNINKEETANENFKISHSIADKVASEGKSIYTSDARDDKRYASQQSVVELNLRSIMCVPLKIKNSIIGVIYLDNSSHAKLFLKSDLVLFELLAQQAAIAIHNAQLYSRLKLMKLYNEDIITQSPVGIIVLDEQCNLVTINDISLEIFHRNKEAIKTTSNQGQTSSFFELVRDEDFPHWKKMIESVLKSSDRYEEDRYFHNTGYEEKALSLKISKTNSLPGSKVGVILIIEDITEKVILEKYVILSEKLVAKGEMAASIGHELNNYLTIISNNAELMQVNQRRGDIDKAAANVAQVIESIGSMKRFTDGLMDFSKMETETVEYDLRALIENLLFSLKAHKNFSGIKIETSFSVDLPLVHIDVGQVQQVLLNLLTNAADALGDRDRANIIISTIYDEPAQEALITVSDNGCGMSDETAVRVFESHFTTKADGHGLGLSNCRKIIDNHGGSMNVDSLEGEGTTFTIRLPLNG